MINSKFSMNDIPDLSGKVMLITGGNSGLGYESALAMAHKGPKLIITSRSQEKGQTAIANIKAQVPSADIEVMALDLANLADVREFATKFMAKFEQLDVLMNNAGVMALPYRTTADGFEMQFGTNHLGHFALTGHLLPLLIATPNSRIVNVSSGLHERGTMNFDDLHGRKAYDQWGAYSQSKLANVLFSYELQRKLEAAGSTTIAVATHPGYAATNLQHVGPEMSGSFFMKIFSWLGNTFLAQSSADGARSQVYSAVMPDVSGGDYIGPDRGMRGFPAKGKSSPVSYNEADAAKLWEISVAETGVGYEALSGATV